jgi:urease accessory protein
MTSPSPAELHLLYVLLDSNLPTGGFVSSSGLESYAKHGFLASTQTYASKHVTSSTINRKISPAKGLMDFTLAELDNFASTTLCFVADAWKAVDTALSIVSTGKDAAVSALANADERIEKAIAAIEALDQYHDVALLSHVARRSSKAQGVAMLTLYGRGLSAPPGLDEYLPDLGGRDIQLEKRRRTISDGIVDRMKRMIRLGKLPGHLSTSWGVITAALGLPLGELISMAKMPLDEYQLMADRALHVHLFLHTRSLLSSAVRFNHIGPYASSQLLLHPCRDLIDNTISKYLDSTSGQHHRSSGASDDDFWAWADDQEGPATTWPLGEVLTGRHDLQHSRIFNS